MHRFASVALGILIAVTSLAYAGEMDEVVAIDTAQRAIERAVRVGDENLVPKHTLAGARVSGVIAVHHPQTLEPVYGLAPVLSTSGDLVAVIGLDATGLRALWYRFGNLSERFPMVSGREAQAQASQRAATLGRDTVLEEPILIAGFDKHIYWRIAGPTGDIWLVDMDQPGRDVLGTAVGEADEALSPDETSLKRQRQRHMPLRQDLRRPPTGLRSGSLPAAYDIPGIPYHYQITSWYCGPASLQMIFDYHGEEIGQHNIADVANDVVNEGCYSSDMVRSAHFSGKSTAIQDSALEGYTERQLGYYCEEYYWGPDPDIDQVKALLSAHYPIFVMTWYSGAHGSGHFRVIKGYDDSLSVWVLHDPWYYGNMSGPNLLIDQTFFVEDLWVDYAWCWGMIAGPWGLRPSFPSSVAQGDTFPVDLTVYYPGPVPFDGQINAYNSSATISLSAGLALEGGSQSLALPYMLSGDSATVSWDVIATGPVGEWGMAFQAQGKVGYSSYSYGAYSDTIGGHAYETVEITCGPAAGWGAEVRLTDDDAACETCFPSARAMAVGTDGTVHVVWKDTRDGASDVYYQRRVSEVWQPESNITTGSGFSYSPCVATGPDGSVHVAWAGTQDGNHEIYYRSWTPGSGWGAEERVTNYHETDFNPSIAAGDSLVYLAWESRQGVSLYRAQAVFASVRNSLGWSPPIDVDASPTRDSFRPSLAYGADGLLHIVYERHTANDPTEHEKIVHKCWDGMVWSSRTGLSTDVSYSRTPVIAAGRDSTLHVVWQDGENGSADIFYVRYDGSTWQTVEQLATGGTEASTPSVAVDGAGVVHVVWVDHRHPETEVYYLAHDGSSWGDEARLTNAPGASLLPTVAATTAIGGPFVVWTDLRHGNAEVYFRGTEGLSGVDRGPTIVSGTEPIRMAPPCPMPFTSSTTVAFWLSRHSQVSLIVFDVQGRLVRRLAVGDYAAGGHQVIWDGRDDPGNRIEPGIYFLRCSSPLGQTSRRVVMIR